MFRIYFSRLMTFTSFPNGGVYVRTYVYISVYISAGVCVCARVSVSVCLCVCTCNTFSRSFRGESSLPTRIVRLIRPTCSLIYRFLYFPLISSQSARLEQPTRINRFSLPDCGFHCVLRNWILDSRLIRFHFSVTFKVNSRQPARCR